MRRARAWRVLVAILVALGLSVAVAGCVSMPSGGPVLPYAVTQGADPQSQNNLQIVPQPPLHDGTPSKIVDGFLAASSSFVGQQRVAREYLTPDDSQKWKPGPGWSATVFKDGPTVKSEQRVQPTAGPDTAYVTVSGSVQATLSTAGEYAFANQTSKASSYHYTLVKDSHGQWRIADAPNQLLLTSTEFTADYQLADLYFFDPTMRYLVPDPVYVPLQATQGDLVNGLVRDLITPPPDWLGQGNATRTAFPKRTTLQGAVTVDGGTASVNLTGTAVSRASTTVKEQISAQLLCTLSGACQGQQQQVKSIALYIDGKPFYARGASPGNPVQNQANNKYPPAAHPQAGGLYYLTASGQLDRVQAPAAKPVTIASIGTGYSSLAVSPDGNYIAVLRKGTLYTGKIGDSRLESQGPETGVTSLSWDRDNNLWMVNSAGPFVLRGNPGTSRMTQVPVAIPAASSLFPYGSNSCTGNSGDVVALRVAPDGVRAAIVYGGTQQVLAFGAIVRSGPAINLSPFYVCKPAGTFTSLSWYGADDVVALSESSGTVTDYPVSGGSETTAQSPPTAASITASAGWGLVTGLPSGTLSGAATVSSAWENLGSGVFPAFPG